MNKINRAFLFVNDSAINVTVPHVIDEVSVCCLVGRKLFVGQGQFGVFLIFYLKCGMFLLNLRLSVYFNEIKRARLAVFKIIL